MEILYMTKGFNCNSSSTHGFAFVPDISKYKDKYEKYMFGWDPFILATPKSKTFYMIVTLLENLKDKYPDDMIQYIVKEWLGIKLTHQNMEVLEAHKSFNSNDENSNKPYAWLDHQSLYFMPYMHRYTSNGMRLHNKEFIRDFYKFIMKDDLVIFGNNDNDGPMDPVPNRLSLPIPQDHYFTMRYRGDGEWADENIICRKDKKHNYWTLFSMNTGFKMRFRIDPDKKLKVKKSYAPELVDIKITEKCNNNCPWCYQDSKHQGEHADDYYLYKLAHKLGELECFEVALGGGEPTIHPQFPKILKDFRNCGIVPNFTTRRLDWLNDSGWAHNVLDLTGRIAFSVSDNADADRIKFLNEKLNNLGIEHTKFLIQIALGTCTEGVLHNLLTSCKHNKFDVSLLGYKRFGRGKQFQPISYDSERVYNMANMFVKECFVNISIDTALAKEWNGFIKRDKSEWSKIGIQLEEGKFSCYVDAVNKKMGACSYTDKLDDLTEVEGLLNFYSKY